MHARIKCFKTSSFTSLAYKNSNDASVSQSDDFIKLQIMLSLNESKI